MAGRTQRNSNANAQAEREGRFRPSLARLAFLRFVQCSWLRWDSVGKRVKGRNSTDTGEVPPTRPVGDTLPQHVSLPPSARSLSASTRAPAPGAHLTPGAHLVHTAHLVAPRGKVIVDSLYSRLIGGYID